MAGRVNPVKSFSARSFRQGSLEEMRWNSRGSYGVRSIELGSRREIPQFFRSVSRVFGILPAVYEKATSD